MYPSPIEFRRVLSGRTGVLVEWRMPPDVAVERVLVFRSLVPIGPEQTEPFYTGAFTPTLRRWTLGPEATGLLDSPDDGREGTDLYYLVLIGDARGDLHLPIIRLTSRHGPTPLDAGVHGAAPHNHDPADVEMVYRDDDPNASTRTLAVAAGLSHLPERRTP